MATPQPIAVSRRRVEPWIGREMAGEHDVERTFASSSFAEDPHPSEILAKRSEWQHRLGELYDHMLRTDAHLAGLELKRGDAVLGLPRRIEPGDASPQAAAAAELARWALSKIEGLGINYRHQLGARGRAIAFEELIWERVGRGPNAGAVVPVAIIDRPMHRFAFKRGVLHVRRAAGDPLPAPPAQFQIFRHGSKDSPWGGNALLDCIYWFWYLKKHGWKFWAVFTEKWAQPTAIARYRHQSGGDGTANQDRQRQALSIVQAIQSEYALAVPEGVVLELLEASRSGSISYKEFVDSCSRAMSIVYLGEINTSGLRPGVGAFASEKVSNEIRKEKVGLDAHDLGAAWSDGILRWISEANYGPDVAPPRLVIESIETEDREQRQQGQERVLAAGEAIPRRDFYLAHQVREPEAGEPVVRRDLATAVPASAAGEPAGVDEVELER